VAKEAREMAWRAYLERNGWKGDNESFVSGFDAGVAEGRRQAADKGWSLRRRLKEAVAAVEATRGRVRDAQARLDAALSARTRERVIECDACDSSLGVSGAGWRLEHHADGSHTARTEEADRG
jgi:hypothetical protein